MNLATTPFVIEIDIGLNFARYKLEPIRLYLWYDNIEQGTAKTSQPFVNAHCSISTYYRVFVKDEVWYDNSRTMDTQWRHKSKISEKLGWCGRQNMLRPYLKIWDWDWIFGRAVKAISSLGVRSPWFVPNEFWKWASIIRKILGFTTSPSTLWVNGSHHLQQKYYVSKMWGHFVVCGFQTTPKIFFFIFSAYISLII